MPHGVISVGKVAPSFVERQIRVQGAGDQKPLVQYARPAIVPSYTTSQPSPPWAATQPWPTAPTRVWVPLS